MTVDDVGIGTNSGSIDVVLVTAPRCHFCDDAGHLLADLAERYQIDVRTIPLTGEEGSELARRFRVPFPPILMVGGRFFGHGRISRRKLIKALEGAMALRSEA